MEPIELRHFIPSSVLELTNEIVDLEEFGRKAMGVNAAALQIISAAMTTLKNDLNMIVAIGLL